MDNHLKEVDLYGISISKISFFSSDCFRLLLPEDVHTRNILQTQIIGFVYLHDCQLTSSLNFCYSFVILLYYMVKM